MSTNNICFYNQNFQSLSGMWASFIVTKNWEGSQINLSGKGSCLPRKGALNYISLEWGYHKWIAVPHSNPSPQPPSKPLTTKHTCPKCWNSPFCHLFLCLNYCCIYGKQCRHWSDAAECSIWSRSTLFAKAYLSKYLRSLQ